MRKRLISLALALLMAFSLSVPAFAAESDFRIVDGILYGYHGTDSTVIVPDGVVEISGPAFHSQDVINVVLPNSVKKLGLGIFNLCWNMSSITIPASVTSIHDEAFANNASEILTIHGAAGSYAETYAKAHNITFVADLPSVTTPNSFPYSIPDTPDFLRFSSEPVGSYRTMIPDTDSDGNVSRKEIRVYEFEVGTKLGLTEEGIKAGYTISNYSSNNFLEDINRTEFTLTKATVFEQWYGVLSPSDPKGFTVYINPVNTKTAFSDVKAGAYYHDAVSWAVKYGVTKGTSDNTFSPNKTCTNAEILTFLYRAWGETLLGRNNPFTDVKESDYYYDTAVWAADFDIVSGSTFNPNKPCTRATAVTYIWKAEGSPEPSGFASFTDVPGGADYAKAVSWAVEEGITKGTGSTTFSPDDICTRGQIVTFLHRYMGW